MDKGAATAEGGPKPDKSTKGHRTWNITHWESSWPQWLLQQLHFQSHSTDEQPLAVIHGAFCCPHCLADRMTTSTFRVLLHDVTYAASVPQTDI